MNLRQEKLVEKLSKRVKELFPDTIIDGVWDKGDGSLAIRVITPTDNEMDIIEAVSPEVW